MKSEASISKPRGQTEISRCRDDFPILQKKVYGKPLSYLDNAATTQKPRQVLDAITHYYTSLNSNVHRGVHFLSNEATQAYEGARQKVQSFIGAADPSEVIFTRGATEAINLVAGSWGRANVRQGDVILLTGMEHHSNIVPWQMLCEEKGAALKVIPVTDTGELDMEAAERLVTERTRFISLVHCSNTLGTVNPVREIIRMAHIFNIPVLVDGAQAAPHLPLNMQELDCDFYVFSGHKMYGPTGIGVLYGKKALLETMPPWQGGGDMIRSVTFEKTTYAAPPQRFEAGTPHIAGAVGLGAAIDYIRGAGLNNIGEHEHGLLQHATETLSGIPGVRIIGTAREKAAAISFVIEGIHPHDAGTVLDREGVAIRTGHHCTQPLMERFGVPATCRASFALYNTKEEIDRLAEAVRKAIKLLA